MNAKRGNTDGRGRNSRRRWRAPLLVASAMALGALVAPAVGNAFGSGGISAGLPRVSLAARGGIGSFTPASVDPKIIAQLAAQISGRVGAGSAPLFRFTPASSETRPDRSVTVAVRVDRAVAQAMAVRGPLPEAASDAGAAQVRIGPAGFTPVGFSLGVARGYQSFAVGAGKPIMARLASAKTSDLPAVRSEMPDFSGFDLGTRDSGAPSRLAPRIELDQRDKAGRAPRTYEAQSSAYQVDVGGSYRLSRNLNVTAGLRYSSDKERLRALSDTTKDSQAVYVGTQFRF